MNSLSSKLLISLCVVFAANMAATQTTGYLGVYTQSNRNVIEERNIEPGVTVTRVVENSPAEAAGIKEGDVILQANGTDITSPAQLLDLAETLPIGAAVKLKIDRDHEIKEVEMQTVARVEPPDADEDSERKTYIENRRLGVEFAALERERAEQLGIKPREGIEVLRLAEDGPLARKKLAPGAVISEIDGETIYSPEEFLAAVNAKELGEKMEIRYANLDGRWQEVDVRLPKQEREVRKINIPLLFGYERAPNKSSLTLPLYIFKRERIEDSAKYRVLWFFTFETGASDELLEVE